MGGTSAAAALAHVSAEAELDQEAEAQAGPFSTHRLGMDQTLAGSSKVPSLLQWQAVLAWHPVCPPHSSAPTLHTAGHAKALDVLRLLMSLCGRSFRQVSSWCK